MVNFKKISLDNIENISVLMNRIIINEEIYTTSIKGMQTLLNFYSIEQITDRFNTPKNVFFHFELNNIIVGFAELENNHLVSLFIDKNMRNKGIGKEFIQFITNESQLYSEITVFASPTSIDFYTKNGFSQQSVNCKENYGLLYMPMILKKETI